MDDFKALIEDSFTRGGNSSVILISHSMGGPMALYLMHKMKQEWKDKYIRVSLYILFPLLLYGLRHDVPGVIVNAVHHHPGSPLGWVGQGLEGVCGW